MVEKRPDDGKVLTKAAFNRMRRVWLSDALQRVAEDPHPYDDVLGADVVDLDAVRRRKVAKATAIKILKGENNFDF